MQHKDRKFQIILLKLQENIEYMKHLATIVIFLLCITSCTIETVSHTLNDIDSYIFERPDSALAALESIDSERLRTSHTKAHHALLYAMALDKNYIDVTNDSIAKVATDYYKKHGPRRNYARALYYLGKSYYYNEEYDKAILEYSKAEKVADKCDSLYLGMIYTAKADTYNKTYNSIEELNCIQAALQIFKKAEVEQYIRPTTYSLGIAYHNCEKYEDAIQTYKYIIESTIEADFYTIHSHLRLAHSIIEHSTPDYNLAESLFRKAKEVYRAELQEKDYWAWAYSLYKIGKFEDADNIILEISITDELIANFWKMRINILLKDYKKAYEYDLLTIDYRNNIINDLLEESLATYQKDYYQVELEASEYKVKTRTTGMILVIIISILIFIIICLLINKSIIRQNEEKEKLLEYAEEIKRQLIEAEKNDYPALKRKYLSLYKSRFETIGALSEQYIQAEGRADIESIMYKKVVKLVNEVKKDYLNRARFEAMLDEDLDMIMTRLRNEMPKLSETDYSIYSYLIVGFDATTISRLLNISVNNIYAHKRRIRIKIENKQPEHASQFLEMLF